MSATRAPSPPLLSFPDNYSVVQRDKIRYGIEPEEKYTDTQEYLMFHIKKMAKTKINPAKAEKKYESLFGKALEI